MNPTHAERVCAYERRSRATPVFRVSCYPCFWLLASGVCARCHEKRALSSVRVMRVNLARSLLMRGGCVDRIFSVAVNACVVRQLHEDDAKSDSANELQNARAIALLLHEAALIDLYSITSAKRAARNVMQLSLRDDRWLGVVDAVDQAKQRAAVRSRVRIDRCFLPSIFRACRSRHVGQGRSTFALSIYRRTEGARRYVGLYFRSFEQGGCSGVPSEHGCP